MYPYFLFALIAYIDNNVNIGLLLLFYEPELLCESCTTVLNVTIKNLSLPLDCILFIHT